MPISLSKILATCHLSKQQKQKQPLPPKQSPRIISCSSYASVSFRAYLAKTTHHPPSSVSWGALSELPKPQRQQMLEEVHRNRRFLGLKRCDFRRGQRWNPCKYIHVPSHAIPASRGEYHPKRLRWKLKIMHLRNHCHNSSLELLTFHAPVEKAHFPSIQQRLNHPKWCRI